MTSAHLSSDHITNKYPVTIRIAVIIWLTVGALGMVSGVLQFSQTGVEAKGQANAQGVAELRKNVSGLCCTFGIAMAFIVVGHQTLYGKAKDTLGNGIGSILLGLLYLSVFALVIVVGVADLKDRFDDRGLTVLGLTTGCVGTGLILAGILALVGRSKYKQWRIESGIANSIRRIR